MCVSVRALRLDYPSAPRFSFSECIYVYVCGELRIGPKLAGFMRARAVGHLPPVFFRASLPHCLSRYIGREISICSSMHMFIANTLCPLYSQPSFSFFFCDARAIFLRNIGEDMCFLLSVLFRRVERERERELRVSPG